MTWNVFLKKVYIKIIYLAKIILNPICLKTEKQLGNPKIRLPHEISDPKTFSLANLEKISSKIPKRFSNPKTISLVHPKNFFNPKKFSMGLTYENVVGFANENVLGLEILLGFLILGFSDFGVFWFWGFLIMGFPTHSPKKLSKKFCPKIILS